LIGLLLFMSAESISVQQGDLWQFGNPSKDLIDLNRLSPPAPPFFSRLLQTLDFRHFDPWATQLFHCVTQSFPLRHPTFSTGSPKVRFADP
jgi:hypothetical protein